jgi:F-type H+-transporting ATPase subunit epsilon
MKSDIESVK